MEYGIGKLLPTYCATQEHKRITQCSQLVFQKIQFRQAVLLYMDEFTQKNTL